MTDLTISQLEKYILTDDKAQALKEITPFTTEYFFLKILNELNKPSKSESEIDKLVEAFTKNVNAPVEKKRLVDLRHLLGKIEKSKEKPEELKKWVEELNSQFLHYKFDFANPSRGTARSELATVQKDDLKSALSAEDLLGLELQALTANIYSAKTRAALSELSPVYFHRLDLERFDMKKDADLIDVVFRDAVKLDRFPNLVDFLARYKKAQPQKTIVADSVWPRLSLEQQEALLAENVFRQNQNLLVSFVQSKFQTAELDDEETPPERRIAGWTRLREYFTGLPQKYRAYRAFFLLKILQLKAKQREYSESLFLEYLSEPYSVDSLPCNEAFKKSFQKLQVEKPADSVIGFSLNINEHLLVHEFLSSILKDAGGIEKYLPFFEEKRLRTIFAEAKLLAGEQVENVHLIFSQAELQNLHARKSLQLVDNPPSFGANDEVVLRLKIKNVARLSVRVFEVNTLAFLLEKGNNNYEAIDVTGLLPSEQYLHAYEQPALVQHTEAFRFPSVSAKARGVFIVDFIGDELNSRAIVRKGGLSLVNDSQTGRNCVIIDEEGRPCAGRQTGLYIGNTFFAADPATSIVSIPLNVAAVAQKVVVLHEDFADFSQLNTEDPRPALALTVVFNAESLAVGNQVALVVRTKLTMNDKLVSLVRLLNVAAEVTTFTSDGLQNKNVFKDLKLRDAEDLLLSFMYPQKVNRIFVRLTGGIKVGAEEKDLSATQSIEVELQGAKVLEAGYFRKNEAGELLLEVLGRNGEPMPLCAVALEVGTKFTSRTKAFQLTTDQSGRVVVGKVGKLVSCVASGVFSRLSYLPEKDHAAIYPLSLTLLEGEELRLPVSGKKAQRIKLLSVPKSGSGAQNLTASNTKVEGSKLVVFGLSAGNFNLGIGRQNIALQVYKGALYSLNGENIKTSNSIVTLPKRTRLLTSHAVRKGAEWEVKVEGDLTNVRAHLLGYSFVPQEKEVLCSRSGTLDCADSTDAQKVFYFEAKQNSYQSGKRLNDEIIYVYDRQGRPNFMGNTLEKPGMLIKRNRIGQTTETKPEINTGGDFAQKEMAASRSRIRVAEPQRCPPPPPAPRPGSFVRATPFLARPGLVSANLKFEDGRLTIPAEALRGYYYASLLVTNGQISQSVELWHATGAIEASDCRLSASKKAGNLYQFERRLTGLLASQPAEVRNIKNTEVCFIENMQELYETLQILQKGDLDLLKEWSFLPRWNNLDPMEKLKLYDKFASHELNLFAFNKDPEFFDSVVRPFIENKREKQFVDLWLLGKKKETCRADDLSALQGLSKLELALLAQASAGSNPELNAAILKYLKSASSLQKVDEKRKIQIFDTLLSSRGEKPDSKPKVALEKAKEMQDQMNTMIQRGANLNMNAMVLQSNALQSRAFMGGMARSAPAPPNTFGRSARRQESRRSGGGMEMAEEEAFQGEMDECQDVDLNVDFVAEAKVFTPIQGTIEYCERQYYKQTLDSAIQPFWSELAEHLSARGSAKNFLPSSFIYAANSFSDSIAMLSFIDLSFEKVKMDSKVSGTDLALLPATNIILLAKEIIERSGEPIDLNVLCAQRFFDPEDRFVYDEEDPSLKMDKRVDEFLVGRVYGCRVVVTNSTSSDLGLELIHEVPAGAIPLDSPDFLKVHNIVLNSLQSQLFDFHFYFPAEGEFAVYPATVVKGGKVVASARVEATLPVRRQKTVRNMETIADILAVGSAEDILEFVRAKNVLNNKIFSFSSIYWLLKNKDFYQRLLAVLRQKGVFEQTVWSFSLFHSDLPALRELLAATTRADRGPFGFVRFLKSELLSLDAFEVREYYPLINPRAHSLGAERVNIINNAFKATYTGFLKYLLEKPAPSAEDWLLLASYLIAQDRFQDAEGVLQRAERESALEQPSTRIQRDYLLAYADFASGYPSFSVAKRICADYLAYPVLSWRNLFIEMANQLAEFEESEAIETAQAQRQGEAKNKEKAAKLPTFSAEALPNGFKIVAQNLAKISVEYYKVDIEVLFSLNPFGLQSSRAFSHVMPFRQEELALGGEAYASQSHALPEGLQAENLFLKLSVNEQGVAKSEFLSLVPFRLDHQVSADFGILKLVDPASRKPVPKVYVKCFVRYKSGATAFYKDGYTDLRGSFDYVSLSKDELNDVEKFAVIVCSPQFGFKMLELVPPKRIGRVEGEAKQLVSKNWEQVREQQGKTKAFSKYTNLY